MTATGAPPSQRLRDTTTTNLFFDLFHFSHSDSIIFNVVTITRASRGGSISSPLLTALFFIRDALPILPSKLTQQLRSPPIQLISPTGELQRSFKIEENPRNAIQVDDD
ncbi:unnamed protein product [Vicia faba]|uniref:Uncharacterized protein n=1 Tax=Vicia faba TaxID=3906 RepID=A0AAV1AQJ2_VICFA|nr:unnamed protein product [Vicia faba]